MKIGKTVVRGWFVYIVRCSNRTLYTGVTTDVARRIKEHNSGRGARYTRAFGPVVLVWSRKSRTRSSALKTECRIKRLSREKKEALVKLKKS